MKKATITLLLFAVAFACQQAKPEQPDDQWHYFVFSQKAQDRTNRTCICKAAKPFTFIASSAKDVEYYKGLNPDATLVDSVSATTAGLMDQITCGYSQSYSYE